MKTKAFIRVVHFLIIILTTLLTESCETEIPFEDSTPPTFSFEITGDGFNHTFNQDSDFDNIQLNLRNDATYEFIFSGGDQGGVERIQWFISGSSNTVLLDPVLSPWTLSNITPLQDLVEWRGTRSNPLTGSIIAGDLQIRGRNIGTSYRFNVADFGGERRRPNRVSKELNLYFGDHPTEIINL